MLADYLNLLFAGRPKTKDKLENDATNFHYPESASLSTVCHFLYLNAGSSFALSRYCVSSLMLTPVVPSPKEQSDDQVHRCLRSIVNDL